VDPARQTGYHDKPTLSELCSEIAGEAPTIRRGVARPDDSDHRLPEQSGLAEHGQDRRGGLHRAQRTRVNGLAPTDEPRPGPVEYCKLGLGLSARGCGYGLSALAAAGKTRQHVEGSSRRTKTAQHRVKGDRADRLGTDEPQPVEALLWIELACGQG